MKKLLCEADSDIQYFKLQIVQEIERGQKLQVTDLWLRIDLLLLNELENSVTLGYDNIYCPVMEQKIMNEMKTRNKSFWTTDLCCR
jgi:hypothetical protein